MAASFHQLLLVSRVHQHLLIAMNELGENYEEQVETLLATGCNIFLDSGIFNLTMNHGRKHKMEMYDVLSLAPTEVDGFQELFDKYCKVIEKCGDRLWGYIELDQGGMVNKRKTRAVLEGKGFKPIPVYHPMNDGWDYFDELAAKYDRICVGNIIASDEDIRIRLLSTLWERKRRYPNLWIHLLGMTPNMTSMAYPFNSCDSSALAGRWMIWPFSFTPSRSAASSCWRLAFSGVASSVRKSCEYMPLTGSGSPLGAGMNIRSPRVWLPCGFLASHALATSM